MKVALVTPGWPSSEFSNGIATYVDVMRHGFAEIGVESIALAIQTSGLVPADVVPLADLTNRGRSPRDLLNRIRGRLFPHDQARIERAESIVRGINSLQKKIQPDLVEMEETLGTFDLVASKIDIPLVVRLHGPYFLNAAALSDPHDRYYRNRVAWEKKTITSAQFVTSPSTDLLQWVRREYGISMTHAETIPNPLPPVTPGTQWVPELADSNLILFVGRFDKHKGGDIMLKAFAKVAAQRPNIKLAFVGPDWGLGDGIGGKTSYEQFVSSQIPDASIRNRIQRLGQKTSKEISSLRLQSAFTVVPSRYDNFPMTVLEGLSHGTPLIAARTGGIPEMLVDQQSGLLFEPENINDLAQCMERLLDQPELAARLASQGFEDAVTRFAPAVVAMQTKDYYEQVIKRFSVLR